LFLKFLNSILIIKYLYSFHLLITFNKSYYQLYLIKLLYLLTSNIKKKAFFKILNLFIYYKIVLITKTILKIGIVTEFKSGFIFYDLIVSQILIFIVTLL